jgi:hypothetical protein
VQQSEDTLKAAIVELKSALDGRIAALVQAAETVAGVNDALVGVQNFFEQRPTQLGEELDTKLAQPLDRALAQLNTLEKSLAPLARSFQVARRRQLLATLLIGVTLGVLSSAILFLQ